MPAKSLEHLIEWANMDIVCPTHEHYIRYAAENAVDIVLVLEDSLTGGQAGQG